MRKEKQNENKINRKNENYELLLYTNIVEHKYM